MSNTNFLNTTLRNIIAAPAVFICWCLLFVSSCKDPLIDDKGLLNKDDELGLDKDTLSMSAFSFFQPAVKASGISVGALGNVQDAAFGKAHASFYAQCRISSPNINFGNGATLDSVVLRLRYNGTYGAFTTPLDIYVYELNESMAEGTTYLTNKSFAVKIPPIGTAVAVIPNSTDSQYVYGVKIAPHLRVPLNMSFGNKILQADTNQLKDNSTFLELFKGFYITASSNVQGNGLMYLDLTSVVSGISLYYHNNDADSLTFSIPVSGVAVNHFDNIYAGTPVLSSVTTPNPAGEQKLYLQGGAGVYGKLQIKDLDSLPQNILVNKAEIILTQSVTDTGYVPPAVLDLFRIDDVGNEQELEDDGFSHFGGTSEYVNINGATVVRYKFNIRTYFQKLLQGVYKNNGFYLKTLTPYSNTERVVIANLGTDPNYTISLYITYTKM